MRWHPSAHSREVGRLSRDAGYPPSSSSPLLICLPLPDFSTPPPGLRLGTCGPLPRLNFFHSPSLPFGGRPDAMTQSPLFCERDCLPPRALQLSADTCNSCIKNLGSQLNCTHPCGAEKTEKESNLRLGDRLGPPGD